MSDIDAKREENNKKLNEARDKALQKLQDARAAANAAAAAASKCAADVEKAKATAEAAEKDAEDKYDIIDAKELADYYKEELEKADKQLRFAKRLKAEAEKDRKNAGIFDFTNRMVAQKTYDSACAKEVQAQGKIKAAQDKLKNIKNVPTQDEYNKAKQIVEAAEKAAEDYEKTKKECEKITKEAEAAAAALADLGYTEDDLNKIQDLFTKASKKYAGVSTAWVRNDAKNKELLDIRNISGKNFRSVASYTDGKRNDGALNALAGGGAGISPSRSFYMNEDYLFSDSLASPTLDSTALVSKPELQFLILSEYQPYVALSISDLLPKVAKAAAEGLQFVGSLIGGTVVSIARSSLINGQINECARNPEELYNMAYSGASSGARERHYFTPDPVQQVQNMFLGGKWLNTYELPFWGNNYLEANYSDAWKTGNIEKEGALGEHLGKMFGNFGIDYPSMPRFKVSMDPTRKIETSFYLINSSSQWLKKNFEFIQAIFAGTSWMHLKYCVVRPSNVYHVLCPGRFQMFWAAMDSSITFEGKLRKNREVSNALRTIGINSIDEDMLWPDAWKITLKIRDLTPNNFNLYADYYARGYIEDEVAALANEISIGKMISELGSYFKKVKDDAAIAAKDLQEQAANSLNDIDVGNEQINDLLHETAGLIRGDAPANNGEE